MPWYLNVLCTKVFHFDDIQFIYFPCIAHGFCVTYKKPWQYDGVINEEYFWDYAKNSPCYEHILNMKASFTDEMKKAREEANINIVVHAGQIVEKDEKTFYNCLIKNGNWLDKINFNEVGDVFVAAKK